jgi:lysozyme
MFKELLARFTDALGIKSKVEIPYRRPLTYVFNREGLELIKSFEGFYQNAYLCSAGVPTIGYGTTIYPDGTKVSLGQVCTKAKAEIWLEIDISRKQNKVAPCLRAIGAELTSNQYSALISLVYNVGEGVVTNTARSMYKAIRSGDYALMADTFLLYNKAGGKPLAGLIRRREAERALFLKNEKARD